MTSEARAGVLQPLPAGIPSLQGICRFDYNHTERLLATRQKINQQDPVTLNAIRYNESGEVITKYLHSNQTTGILTFVQKVDYNYNIRGWMNMINSPGLENDNDMFGMSYIII